MKERNGKMSEEQKEKMSTFEKFKCIRDLIVKKVMEGYVYKEHWSKEFRITDFDRLPKGFWLPERY